MKSHERTAMRKRTLRAAWNDQGRFGSSLELACGEKLLSFLSGRSRKAIVGVYAILVRLDAKGSPVTSVSSRDPGFAAEMPTYSTIAC